MSGLLSGIEIGKTEAVHGMGDLCVGDRCFFLFAA
jgi:hypothetical protein